MVIGKVAHEILLFTSLSEENSEDIYGYIFIIYTLNNYILYTSYISFRNRIPGITV